MINGMNLVSAQCPCCSAQLEVNAELEKAFCQYCGTQFFVTKAITNHNTYNTTVNKTNTSYNLHGSIKQNTINQNTSVKVGKKGTVEAVLDYVENKRRLEEEEERRRKEEARLRRKEFNGFVKRNWQLIISIIIGFITTSRILGFFKINGFVPFLLCCIIVTALFLIFFNMIIGKVNAYKESDNKAKLAKEDFERTKNATIKTVDFVIQNWKIVLPVAAVILIISVIISIIL